MRTKRRHSVTVSTVAAIAFLTGVFALTPGGHAKENEAAFKARCAECHGPKDILYWGRQRADAAARATWLDQFLRKHYPPSEAERALIIAYIQATIAAPK